MLRAFNGAAPVRTRIGCSISADGKLINCLQWGRACEDADSHRAVQNPAERRYLQWGRACEDADSSRASARWSISTCLQWGRACEDADRWAIAPEQRMDEFPSMGPRL